MINQPKITHKLRMTRTFIECNKTKKYIAECTFQKGQNLFDPNGRFLKLFKIPPMNNHQLPPKRKKCEKQPQKSKIFQFPCFAFVEKREIRSPLICLGPYFPSSSSSSSFDKNLNQTNFRSSSSIFFFFFFYLNDSKDKNQNFIFCVNGTFSFQSNRRT